MKKLISRFGLLGAVIITTALIGCGIVSGTFIVVYPFAFSFTAGQTIYYEYVDVTDMATWKDHKDDIDDITLVGFEIWFTNTNTTSDTFDVYIDNAPEEDTLDLTDVNDIMANADLILQDITVPPGKSNITYGSSFKHITNVDIIKKYAKLGKFHYYGFSSIAPNLVRADSGKVIITFTASK